MIIRIVKLSFHEANKEAFFKIFEDSKHLIRGFDGCLHLELLQHVKDSGVFFTYSHWISEEHLNAYRNSPLFAETWAKTKVLFNDAPQAWSVCSRELVTKDF